MKPEQKTGQKSSAPMAAGKKPECIGHYIAIAECMPMAWQGAWRRFLYPGLNLKEAARLQGKAVRPDLVKSDGAEKQLHQHGAKKETGLQPNGRRCPSVQKSGIWKAGEETRAAREHRESCRPD